MDSQNTYTSNHDLQMQFCILLCSILREECRTRNTAKECIDILQGVPDEIHCISPDVRDYINSEIAHFEANAEKYEVERCRARANNGGEAPECSPELEAEWTVLYLIAAELDDRNHYTPDKEELCGGEGSDEYEDEPEEWGETGEPYHGGGPEAGGPGDLGPIDRAKCLDDLPACIPAPIPGLTAHDHHDKDHYQHWASAVKAFAYEGPNYYSQVCNYVDTRLTPRYEVLKKTLLTLCDYYGHNPAPSPAPAQAVALLLRQSDTIFTPQPDGGVWGPEM